MQGNPLAETDRPYRLLVEAVVDYAIYLIDPEGRIATWNPGARRLKGYEGAEAIGQHYSLFFTEEDRGSGRPEAALETARRHGRFEAEGWRVRKDGSRFWALAVLDAVRDRDGDVVGFAKSGSAARRHRAAPKVLRLDLSVRLPTGWDTPRARVAGFPGMARTTPPNRPARRRVAPRLGQANKTPSAARGVSLEVISLEAAKPVTTSARESAPASKALVQWAIPSVSPGRPKALR